MGVDRRNFLKALGLTGAAIGTGKPLGATPAVNEDETEFHGILFDSTWCAGCQGCEIACAEAHGLEGPALEDVPEVGLKRKANENRRTVVNAHETSAGEFFVKSQCMQCAQPACVSACLTKAMYKQKDGSVIWREEKCTDRRSPTAHC